MENGATAVFGGGCFWCTEAVFKMLRGIRAVTPGYAGGEGENPHYEEVSGGATGHAEVVKIDYDPSKISYRDLLTVFFGSHDPTSVNRQGNDVGTQYRSVIFYTAEAQKAEAEAFVRELNASNKEGKTIATEVVPLSRFYEAENYHKDYYASNPKNPYCELVINPKLEKVQKEFAELLERKGDV
ncbi:peptide-methionine (S)-S-oxide reductase MsrA [Candidatus Parcubacteria bacterium]|nr:peptide-methionine (S)-S-oxide reductase MsrA [Candidatus Parcubacteria bacterium]